MLINNVPTDNWNGEALTFSIDQDTFDCNDLGDNTVILTATDNQGNTSTCAATVTILENSSGQLLECVDSYTVVLDNLGNATIDYIDLTTNTSTNSSCGDNITYTLSQDTFNCLDYSTATPTEVITNGSFENDFSNWVTRVENGTVTGGCQQGWKRLSDSSTICCCVSEVFPTDGNFGMFTSFDGVANINYVFRTNFLGTKRW